MGYFAGRQRWGLIIVFAISMGVVKPMNATVPYSLVATNSTNHLVMPRAAGHGKGTNLRTPYSLKVQMWRAWWEAKDYWVYGVPQLLKEHKTRVVCSVPLLLGLSAVIFRANRRGKENEMACAPHEPGAEVLDDSAAVLTSGKHEKDRSAPND